MKNILKYIIPYDFYQFSKKTASDFASQVHFSRL